MKKLLLILLLAILIFIIWFCYCCINPNLSDYGCPIEVDEPIECLDSIGVDTITVDGVNVIFQDNAIVIYEDTIFRSATAAEAFEECLEDKYDNIIKNLLIGNSLRLPPFKEGTLSNCDCNRSIYIYENDLLESIGAETGVVASNNSGTETEGGHNSLNYIFKVEGFVPEGVRDVVTNNGNCFDSKETFTIDQSPINSGGLLSEDKERSLLEQLTDAYWQRNNSSNARSCADALSLAGINKKRIAILDTGIDLLLMDEGTVANGLFDRHPCLDDPIGWNYVGANQETDDDMGHGTTVALSFLHGMKNSDAQVRDKYEVLPVKVMNECGRGTLFDIACGVYYAIDKDSDMINMSLGTYAEECQILEIAIAEAMDSNIMVVTSSGNDSEDLSELDNLLHYPSEFRFLENINNERLTFEISAMCENPHCLDQVDTLWGFSNWRTDHYNFMAHGVHYELLYSPFMNVSQLEAVNGTSFATPLFAAAIMIETMTGQNGAVYKNDTDMLGATVNYQVPNPQGIDLQYFDWPQ